MNTAELDLRDLSRVCRDLARSEITSMPAMAGRFGPGGTEPGVIDWSASGLGLDSLASMQLATAAATWCNAFDKGFEDLFLAKRNTIDWAAAMHRVATLGGRHLVFSTSGSTGMRKHIRHQLGRLMDEARGWASLLQIGEQHEAGDSRVERIQIQRVVTLAPTHHIYGFIWGVLVPKALGVPAIDASLQAFPPLLSGDLVVAVPDQWAWLAKAEHTTHGWPVNVKGVSSTAPLPAAVHRLLTASALRFNAVGEARKPPLAQLLHIYGSAETAGLAWRDDPDQPYTLAAGRRRTAANGIALEQPGDAPAELAVQDQLDWVDPLRFRVVARLDQCVQVAGHNVSPSWVAAQLASHASVARAAVRLTSSVDSSAVSPRLKAFIVLKHTSAATAAQQVEAWAAEHLPWYANPGSFTYGQALPQNSMGKLCDWPTLA